MQSHTSYIRFAHSLPPAPLKMNVAQSRLISLGADSSMGCGDLMFSSHTIFAVTTACTIFKYFGSRRNKVGISVALVGE